MPRGLKGTLYAPGERKGNRYYVYRHQGHEFVCRDENGEKTADARAARRAVQRFHQNLSRARRAAPAGPRTFGEVAELYIRGRDLSALEERRVRRLIADPIGGMPVALVRQADIDAAAQRIRSPDARKLELSAATRNREVYAPVAAILHYAEENEWAAYRRVRRLKEPKPETRRPASGVADTLLANTEGLQHLLLLLWFRQGWRVQESLSLREDKIDLAAREMALFVRKARTWKTMPMHDDVFLALANRVGPRQERVFPWTRWQVYHWLREITQRLGVRFTPHMARHEFGSLIRDGKALVEVGSWTSEKSTARYVSGDAEFRRAILQRVGGKQRGS
jgi:hypothetical protein